MLCQGTGSYFFDMWVDETLNGMKNKWGKSTLTGSFHDEQINAVKDSPVIVQDTKDIIASSIDKVNIKFKLRRLLGCESQVGKRYSEIH